MLTHHSVGNARSINPEAGDHAISLEPREQAAAAAAVRASWREFPYYARRYGERGYRFSLSDTGWIETLCQHPVTEARSQVLWLARLLAARGMPSYLLERHLEFLHQELVSAAPQRTERYQIIAQCAAALREMREVQLSSARFDQLAARFEAAVAEHPARIANMGAILVSAVTDEAWIAAGAVTAVQGWACDPTMFDAAWTSAVQDFLAQARIAARPDSQPAR
jgi:hypothetical protein